jgi:BirA family transcriptional regulator, biotin operon repressor / biotin---[acetyl-CoA-carboxylase] ligase
LTVVTETARMSREARARLLEILADGHFHSGQALAEAIGVSRTAIWKHIHALRRRGLDVHAVTGKGYRLAGSVDLLCADGIRQALASDIAASVAAITVPFELPSTNQYLCEQAYAGDVHGHVCLTEYQSAGRGRHGNSWVSPIAAGLYLSIGWRNESVPEPLTGLSLAAGVAAVRALGDCGIDGVGLKWPNDLLHDGRKLGGILLHVQGEADGPCVLVLGIGVNVRLPPSLAAGIEQPVTDLAHVGRLTSRNQLAAALINHLVRCLKDFPRNGFEPYLPDWRRYDCISGRRVTLHAGTNRINGQMLGVDAAGALLLGVDNSVRRYASGELSLRTMAS